MNTASESGLYGNAGQANYAAAKAGIAVHDRSCMARELERIGVRVNAIAPVARTRLTEALAGDYMKADESGFDRFAPANVAAVACWLASDSGRGHLGPGGQGAGRAAPAARGLAPADRGHRRQGVDARLGGRRCATPSWATPTARSRRSSSRRRRPTARRTHGRMSATAA